MDTQICSAIENRQVLAFNYDGYPRVVEPHAYGLSKTGKDMLRAYQVAGESKSDPTLGWRPFLVKKIKNLTILDQTFTGTRPLYNPEDKSMVRVYCCLPLN